MTLDNIAGLTIPPAEMQELIDALAEMGPDATVVPFPVDRPKAA